jgi:formylmethanofuran dehydrogenase subunit E
MTYLFERLKDHEGHAIEIRSYGTPPINMSLECAECGEVIFDTDVYDLKGIKQ